MKSIMSPAEFLTQANDSRTKTLAAILKNIKEKSNLAHYQITEEDYEDANSVMNSLKEVQTITAVKGYLTFMVMNLNSDCWKGTDAMNVLYDAQLSGSPLFVLRGAGLIVACHLLESGFNVAIVPHFYEETYNETRFRMRLKLIATVVEPSSEQKPSVGF